jgi:hypothetical protein
VRHKRPARAAAVASVLAAAMAFGVACSAKDDAGAAAAVGKDGVKTGPGAPTARSPSVR